MTIFETYEAQKFELEEKVLTRLDNWDFKGTLADLAKEAGVPRHTLFNFKKTGTVKLEALLAIAKVLKIKAGINGVH
ncbi:hypothetical protein EHQ53_14230 [Leptospira langatensis]|uniref:XRE family transcriptional regulator n=1 Tax=Leptospira langatensis TaxID=2484983 RepID=A0ABY2M9B8_9LEPT|nr:hypothetical protein [Leptospira langatensis]TGL39675.1 hypothetical protein EHQ53_14230 [Leptospira langatensis]